MDYKSRAELAAKVDWEGGLEEFLFNYGMDPEDAPDEEIAVLIQKIYSAYPVREMEQLQTLLENAVEPDVTGPLVEWEKLD